MDDPKLIDSLPKRVRPVGIPKASADTQMAPAESYNYHPLLPPSDPENPIAKEDERTCSICMEEVDVRPGPNGEVLLGINPRRGYALAPCHHLFHTKCLSQWLAIKVSRKVFPCF